METHVEDNVHKLRLRLIDSVRERERISSIDLTSSRNSIINVEALMNTSNEHVSVEWSSLPFSLLRSTRYRYLTTNGLFCRKRNFSLVSYAEWLLYAEYSTTQWINSATRSSKSFKSTNIVINDDVGDQSDNKQWSIFTRVAQSNPSRFFIDIIHALDPLFTFQIQRSIILSLDRLAMEPDVQNIADIERDLEIRQIQVRSRWIPLKKVRSIVLGFVE